MYECDYNTKHKACERAIKLQKDHIRKCKSLRKYGKVTEFQTTASYMFISLQGIRVENPFCSGKENCKMRASHVIPMFYIEVEKPRQVENKALDVCIQKTYNTLGC